MRLSASKPVSNNLISFQALPQTREDAALAGCAAACYEIRLESV